MDITVGIVSAAVTLLVLGFILVIHHYYKHRPNGHEPLHGYDRAFQMSDVCNFHSCSHEMWVIAFWTTSMILFLAAVGVEVQSKK